MADFSIDLIGTPEDVQAMVDKASRIDGAQAYKKEWINPGLCRVWYRNNKDKAPNDLVAAIKRKAGLTKAKAKPGKKSRKLKPGDMTMGGSKDGINWTEVDLATGETVTATPVENGEVVIDGEK